MLNEAFKFCKCEFRLKALEDMLLPLNKASMLRGGFGHIFKSLNCANRLSKSCKECPLNKTCAYYVIFETRDAADIARPYIFSDCDFDDARRSYRTGDMISFELTLFGKAIEYLPHFIYSFIELGNAGLTKRRYKFSLSSVIAKNASSTSSDAAIQVFDGSQILSQPVMHSWNTIVGSDFKPQSLIAFNFLSPLRFEFANKLVKPKELTFEMIIQSLTRRINAIAKYHCCYDPKIDHRSLLNITRDIKPIKSNLRWQDWTRYSSRQNAKMEFGGLVGNIIFQGDLTGFMPYLQLGEIIHIGKNATFGNGKYSLSISEEK
ncbi:MAG: CRISPR system precrRNA processing endoribonuclease RAMP protein Cas6 [Endomicrobium sp.]|nr:CRISPR system precrRNA processing endoribonuclease RAMP protein Cas6 [Endomicrobium sp.]